MNALTQAGRAQVPIRSPPLQAMNNARPPAVTALTRDTTSSPSGKRCRWGREASCVVGEILPAQTLLRRNT